VAFWDAAGGPETRTDFPDFDFGFEFPWAGERNFEGWLVIIDVPGVSPFGFTIVEGLSTFLGVAEIAFELPDEPFAA
jgi:hypothetical protein